MQNEDGKQAPVAISAQTIREFFGIAGGGLAGYGAWLHYQPAGFVVGGGLLVVLAIVGTIRAH